LWRAITLTEFSQMATILLSAAGAAIGSGFGGTVLGLSGAVIGRAVGATLGQMIDQRLLGAGSEAVEVGQIERLRLMGASEGVGIARLWGRSRLTGQVIWATRFLETATTSGGGGGGGKGSRRAPPQAEVTQYSYSVSLALALCEGEILRIGRIWADGQEIAPSSLNLRLYRGTKTQLPDPKMVAVEGAGQVPAYRGLAYVVIEDLPLGGFGNRVPNLSFEVIRPAQGGQTIQGGTGLPGWINGAALIPGTGEYALATSPVFYNFGRGAKRAANKNTLSGQSDFATSLADLRAELPRARAVSLVVSWFGDDLRCGHCTVRPKVEQKAHDGLEMPWRVSGLTRAQAQEIPKLEGRAVYGGTPTDQSVIEAIRALNAAGQQVTFYPFILMQQLAGNGLPDPYSDAPNQPALPWRGRITGSIAPGRAGSPDGMPAATSEIDAFFGTASAAQFSRSGNNVVYTGPDQWRYRRFILHYAHLCAAAGGVESFVIGSEMRALTQLRGGNHSFPAVTRLRQLAGEVRAILGPQCKISYAADWSEYFGAHVDGNVYFHLDPLWGDTNIDYIAIDNYMPLSDWRAGAGHADAHWGSVLNVDYLAANVAGGEGYDWYYATPEDEAAQIRTPITDGAFGEDWIFRYKDLRGWWENYHHNRINGVRAPSPTAWVPASKPFRFTEYGCAAIDNGTNQPNRFLDPKSSEGGLPKYSNGLRDDAVQLAYYAAQHKYWTNPAHNPVSAIYGAAMLDFDKALAWAWDTRPFPDFPRNTALWSDGANYEAGHWINGRTGNQTLAGVIAEIAGGGDHLDTARAFGAVRGYSSQQVSAARALLQPLLQAFDTEAVERGGMLRFQSRALARHVDIDPQHMVRPPGDAPPYEVTRAGLAEETGRMRLSYIEAEGNYSARVAEAIYPDQSGPLILAQSEMAMVLTDTEAAQMAQRFMAQSRIGRETARFALPKSVAGIGNGLGAGDVVRLEGQTYRIDRAELGSFCTIEAVRVQDSLSAPMILAPQPARAWRRPLVDAPVEVQFFDLPLISGEEPPHAPYVAAFADPWRGPVAVWSAVEEDDDYAGAGLLGSPTRLGVTQTPLFAAQAGVWDRGPALRVQLLGGDLSSASMGRVLAGQNLALIGDGTPANCELFQFAQAQLVGPNTYDLSLRLRGQAGSDAVMTQVWPAGSQFALLDGAVQQISLPASARGLERSYRIGRAAAGYDAPETVPIRAAFQGMGLRPYRVAHLRAQMQGADLAVSWQRRTRIDGDSWEGIEVPLAESREAYVLRIWQGGAVRREVELPLPSFTYSAAMRLADGVGAGFDIAVAQQSDAFGAGPFRRLTVQL
jgi:hypothetical protein